MIESITLDLSTNNEGWVPKTLLQSFDHYIPDKVVSNGYIDNRQVLVYFKDGEEIARSENGVCKYTPKFKELCHMMVDRMFEEET